MSGQSPGRWFLSLTTRNNPIQFALCCCCCTLGSQVGQCPVLSARLFFAHNQLPTLPTCPPLHPCLIAANLDGQSNPSNVQYSSSLGRFCIFHHTRYRPRKSGPPPTSRFFAEAGRRRWSTPCSDLECPLQPTPPLVLFFMHGIFQPPQRAKLYWYWLVPWMYLRVRTTSSLALPIVLTYQPIAKD